MRIKDGFVLRPLGNEYILLGESVEQVDFNRMLRYNETAAYLWKALQGQDFSEEDMANLLCEEYDIDRETALADCCELVASWRELNIID